MTASIAGLSTFELMTAVTSAPSASPSKADPAAQARRVGAWSRQASANGEPKAVRPVARPFRSGSRLSPSSRRACTTSAMVTAPTATATIQRTGAQLSSVNAMVCWPQPIGEIQLGQAGSSVRLAMSGLPSASPPARRA
jgi:hypothetical protein